MQDRKKMHVTMQFADTLRANFNASLDGVKATQQAIDANVNELKAAKDNTDNNINTLLNRLSKVEENLATLQDNLNKADSIAAYAVWTISNGQPQIVTRKNIKGVGRIGVGEYIFTYNTPVAAASPYSVELQSLTSGAVISYVTQSTMSSISIRLLINVGQLINGVDLAGCLIIFK